MIVYVTGQDSSVTLTGQEMAKLGLKFVAAVSNRRGTACIIQEGENFLIARCGVDGNGNFIFPQQDVH
ncbi:MAG: hypothetical protein IT558_03315 [Alphaproteobacteria bacterium]|nr:hypothetical protein [Alphaproteobacteria bacterium]